MTSPYEEGDPAAKVCILGEAPARTEMRQNRPLVGPSGQLLEQCMHSAKLVRRECYITNLFEFEARKDRTGNTIKDQNGNILWSKKTGLTEYGVDASKGCRDRLSSSGANVIIPLGGTALDSVFGDSRIMKWRGSILQSSGLVEGRKLIPTVHPAACLRGKYLWRHLLISDLDRARQNSASPDLNLTERTLIIDPSYSDVIEYMNEAKKLNAFASDIECLNHQVSCFCIAPSAKESMCIPLVSDRGQHCWTIEQELDIWLLYAELLESEKIMKINQNIIFDMGFLFTQNNIQTAGPIGCTMIAHHIMFPDFPKGLDFLCSMHTDIPYYKDDGKLWAKPWNDLDLFWRYNARDGVAAYAIWDVLAPLMEKEGYMGTYQDTIDLFPSLMYMMGRGIKVDREELEVTKTRVKKEIASKEEELIEKADYPFNVASPKQCQEYFYVNKGIKPYVSRSTGRPTTDDKAMSRIYRRFHYPEAKLVQELRSLNKLLGTYLEVGIDKDGRIRSSYNPRGTTTGRLSSSQTIFGTGMNMQNLHPEFKSFLVADME